MNDLKQKLEDWKLTSRKKDRDLNETLQLKEREWNDTLRKKEEEWNEILQKREKEWGEALEKKEKECSEALRKKNYDLNVVGKSWREAKIEIDKIYTQTQEFDQVREDELIKKTWQLRVHIRNFANQNFGNEDINTDIIPDRIEAHIEIPHGLFIACYEDPSIHPMLVRAFLWAFITKEIFGTFFWTGERMFMAMVSLEELLGTTLPYGLEAESEFQIWRGNPRTLFLEALKRNKEDEREFRRKYILRKVLYVLTALKPLSKMQENDLHHHLLKLLNEALNLDILISYQPAKARWLYRSPTDLGKFDQKLMKSEPSDEQIGDGRNPMLVLAPGIIKGDKPTGEDFDVKNVLVKMEVGRLEPRPIQPPKPPSEDASVKKPQFW